MLVKAGTPMHHRILRHLRANVVAYLALFLALGGTSVAAVSLANHSINPIELNPRNIGGYVREWASVNANGRVVASGGRVTVRVEPSAFPGRYFLTWHTKLTGPCRVLGSVDTGAGGVPGYLTGGFSGIPRTAPTGIVYTYSAQGQPTPAPFDVELLCSTPR
jgi:hypothetical protein